MSCRVHFFDGGISCVFFTTLGVSACVGTALAFATPAHAAFISETEPNDTAAEADELQPDQDSPEANEVGISGDTTASDDDFSTFLLDLTGYTSGDSVTFSATVSNNSNNLLLDLFHESDLVDPVYTADYGRNHASAGVRTRTVELIESGQYFAKLRANNGSKSYTFWAEGTNGATVEVVPEPASLALLGLGGLAMLGRGRRKA